MQHSCLVPCADDSPACTPPANVLNRKSSHRPHEGATRVCPLTARRLPIFSAARTRSLRPCRACSSRPTSSAASRVKQTRTLRARWRSWRAIASRTATSRSSTAAPARPPRGCVSCRRRCAAAPLLNVAQDAARCHWRPPPPRPGLGRLCGLRRLQLRVEAAMNGAMMCHAQVVKARSRRLTTLVDSFADACEGEIGSIQRVCVVEAAAKSGKLVSHNKNYTQVRCWRREHSCVVSYESMLFHRAPLVGRCEVRGRGMLHSFTFAAAHRTRPRPLRFCSTTSRAS